MPAIKVGTCCYCGTKAALVLTGRVKHELSCATCGAPLSKLKMLPKFGDQAPAPAAAPARPTLVFTPQKPCKKLRNKPKKKNKIKSLGHKAFSEIWDVVEDIFD